MSKRQISGGCRRALLAGVATFAALAAAVGADAAPRLNGWHKTVLAFARELTRGVDAEQGFTVEYNSYFADLDYGAVLSPASDIRQSSMNIVRRCAYKADEIVETGGLELPSVDTSGTFKFGANATAPPEFATAALAKAGLNIDRKKTVSYAFNDLAIRQLTQSAAEDAVNAPACLSKLGGLDRIYLVRGQVVMRLRLAQSSDSNGAASGALESKLLSDPAKVGFDVSWTRSRAWSLQQKSVRPWFRIVGRMERGADGRFHFVKDFRR